jgi:hypothetical protein
MRGKSFNQLRRFPRNYTALVHAIGDVAYPLSWYVEADVLWLDALPDANHTFT